MKKFVSLIIILTVTYFKCYSQNDWKPGYIIENSRDTIYGLIDNRDSKSNSKVCYFREEEMGETMLFEPGDIFGYRFILGKFFISRSVPVADSSQNVFLEYMINGIADIFHYKDDEDYYFLEKDGELYSLKNTIDYKVFDSKSYEQEKKEYIGVLNVVMHDANMAQDINSTSLSPKSLIKLAKKYHENVCEDGLCIIYEKKEKVKFSYGFQVGAARNKFNFGSRIVTNYAPTNYFGLRLKLENVIKWSENITISADAVLQRFSEYEIEVVRTNAAITYNDEQAFLYVGDKMNVDFKAMALKFPITVNYCLSRGTVQPYFGVGLSNTFIISRNNDFVDYSFDNYFGKTIPSFLIIGLTGRAGLGFKLKSGHILYSEFNIDFTQLSQTGRGAMTFTNEMYGVTIGYEFSAGRQQ